MGIKCEPTFFSSRRFFNRKEILNVFINLGFEGKSNKNKANRIDYYRIQISFLINMYSKKTIQL